MFVSQHIPAYQHSSVFNLAQLLEAYLLVDFNLAHFLDVLFEFIFAQFLDAFLGSPQWSANMVQKKKTGGLAPLLDGLKVKVMVSAAMALT